MPGGRRTASEAVQMRLFEISQALEASLPTDSGESLPSVAGTLTASRASPPAASPPPDLLPLGVYAVVVVALVAIVLLLSWLVGPRHAARRRDLAYESGMPSTGGVHLRFPIRFYLVAIAFLVFDLEAAYLFAWAVAADEVGWLGYLEVLFFTAVLLAGLIFLWGKGALDWASRPPRGDGARSREGRRGLR